MMVPVVTGYATSFVAALGNEPEVDPQDVAALWLGNSQNRVPWGLDLGVRLVNINMFTAFVMIPRCYRTLHTELQHLVAAGDTISDPHLQSPLVFPGSMLQQSREVIVKDVMNVGLFVGQIRDSE
ncbi:hypothetical protein BTVI_141208 [Pitangus sulphuratus]|nr:hypothetical protein BTVI_141208 [Pitangus sulphuratus]